MLGRPGPLRAGGVAVMDVDRPIGGPGEGAVSLTHWTPRRGGPHGAGGHPGRTPRNPLRGRWMATDLRESCATWTTASLIDTYVRLRLSGPQQAAKVALRRLGRDTST